MNIFSHHNIHLCKKLLKRRSTQKGFPLLNLRETRRIEVLNNIIAVDWIFSHSMRFLNIIASCVVVVHLKRKRKGSSLYFPVEL